jgi:hypothetical protein
VKRPAYYGLNLVTESIRSHLYQCNPKLLLYELSQLPKLQVKDRASKFSWLLSHRMQFEQQFKTNELSLEEELVNLVENDRMLWLHWKVGTDGSHGPRPQHELDANLAFLEDHDRSWRIQGGRIDERLHNRYFDLAAVHELSAVVELRRPALDHPVPKRFILSGEVTRSGYQSIWSGRTAKIAASEFTGFNFHEDVSATIRIFWYLFRNERRMLFEQHPKENECHCMSQEIEADLAMISLAGTANVSLEELD